MSEILNNNRYNFTLIKSNVSTFKKFIGSSIYYILKNNNDILIKNQDTGRIDECQFIINNSRLNRKLLTNNFYFLEDSLNNFHVGAIGSNLTTFLQNSNDSLYYCYTDSFVWKYLQSDSYIDNIHSTYAELIETSSGLYFVLQEINKISVYKINETNISLIKSLDNFQLLRALNYNNDIMLIVYKENIPNCGKYIYEDFLNDYFYYYNSPSVFLLKSPEYTTVSSFCSNKSMFPIPCQWDLNLNSFMFSNNKLFSICNGLNEENKQIPVVCIGEIGDTWRYPMTVKPFGDLYNCKHLKISVDNDNNIYCLALSNKNLYMVMYNSSTNEWKNFDSNNILSFEDINITNGSSSSSSSSGVLSQYYYTVKHSGINGVNGHYFISGQSHGKNKYTNNNDLYSIKYNGGFPYSWVIENDNDIIYINNTISDRPPQSFWSPFNSSYSPAPTVQENLI